MAFSVRERDCTELEIVMVLAVEAGYVVTEREPEVTPTFRLLPAKTVEV